MEDYEIIDLFWRRSEDVVQAAAKQYGGYCRAIAGNILGRITRNLALTRRKEQSALKRGGGQADLALNELTACIPASGSVEDAMDEIVLRDSIEAFLRSPSGTDIYDAFCCRCGRISWA